MAGNGEPPAASRARLSGHLTIDCLGPDLLCRVFLRLPSLAALVRVVCACNEWRRVVASDPVFRRRLSAIHSPLLGLFFNPPVDLGPAVPSFSPARRDDPDLAKVIRSGDFFLTRLHVSPRVPPSWTVADARGGLLLLASLRMGEYLLALLNPLKRRVLGYFNLNDANILEDVRGDEPQVLQARLICDDEDPSRFRIFCLAHDEQRLRVLVFAHDNTNGLRLPWIEAPGRSGPELDWLEDGMQVGEFIYWFYRNHRYVIVMDTRELGLRYYVEAIHPSLNLNDYQSYLLLGEHTTNANGLSSSLQIVDADGNRVCRKLGGSHDSIAGTWTAGRVSDLGAELVNMPRDVPLGHLPGEYAELVPVALRDGFLYCTTSRVYQHANIACWYASFNMETGDVERLFLRTNDAGFQPYHMPWPRALLGNYGVFAG